MHAWAACTCAPARSGHVPRGDAPGVASELGGDVHGRAAADGAVLAHEAPQQLLGAAVERAGAVRVRGVKHVDALRRRVVEDALQLGVHARVVAPQELVSPRPRACAT